MNDFAPRTKGPEAQLDVTAGTVHFPDTEVTYHLDNMTAQVVRGLALVGLRTIIRTAKNRVAVYDELLSGNLPGRKSAKRSARRDVTREAIAYAYADAAWKEKGLRAIPGKKPSDTAEYRALFDAGRGLAAGLSKEAIADAKRTPEVMTHLARLTNAPPLSSIFASATVPPAAEAAD